MRNKESARKMAEDGRMNADEAGRSARRKEEDKMEAERLEAELRVAKAMLMTP
jgi:hypothetical protein